MGRTIKITNNRIEEWGGGENQRTLMERKSGEVMEKIINITKNRRNGEEGTIKGNKWK